MNKYQEALKNVEDIFYGTHQGYINENDVEAIQELVDKETPMKPIIKSGGIERCGRCKYQYNPHNDYYCSQCGQCRDWNGEE